MTGKLSVMKIVYMGLNGQPFMIRIKIHLGSNLELIKILTYSGKRVMVSKNKFHILSACSFNRCRKDKFLIFKSCDFFCCE